MSSRYKAYSEYKDSVVEWLDVLASHAYFGSVICENLRNLWTKSLCIGSSSVGYPQITQISADFFRLNGCFLTSYFLLHPSNF
jgi:hypothetical protein